MENFMKEELEGNYPLNQSKLEVLALDAGRTLLDDANTIKKQMVNSMDTQYCNLSSRYFVYGSVKLM